MEILNNFSFLENIPLLVFGLGFTIVFVIFLDGAFILLFAKDFQRIQRGKRTLMKSLYGFLAILIVSSVYLLVSWRTGRGEEDIDQVFGEFPVAPIALNFPPSPRFIKLNNIYFNGPIPIRGNDDIINQEAIFLIICKQGEEYDIIYMGETERRILLSRQKDARCWWDNCQSSDLYLAIFWTAKDESTFAEKEKMRLSLEQEFDPLCLAEK